VIKETILGAINGAVTGMVTAIIAWLWYGNPTLGLVVGLGMSVNLLFAGMAGASIPLIMKSLRLDPAQCATIILTTITDMIGFLGFALLFRNQLM
jgi:magnesium transporter